MSNLPLPNLPMSLAEQGTYERKLSIMLNAFLSEVRREINKDNGWKDITSSVLGSKPGSTSPTLEAFGPSGNRQEYRFDVNDYVWMGAFHINHDIKVGGAAYFHVHWSTNGVQTRTAKWSFEITRALGHNQAAFAAPVTVTVEEAASGTAWKHMIAEVSPASALTLYEPGELLLVTLKRITNGGTDITDKVFGLTVDCHYESDRAATPQKAPDFYN